ncbi:lariat debranching enzyme [Gymnogyps californianus]|uniref:lariat debranching enzyme n=1 Tax=Gymnogyps californianus TaxID=33616 RepID=UPI0021C7CEFD|nr:lariat debranching enzyme [Gymnogyps californianus]
MKVAVAGCCHGALDKMYETLELLQRRHNVRPDLLLCCGDFQAVRNEADLRCMAVPAKYRHMQTFYRYYSGEKKAPVLTVFIGGNHEASNHLQELPYGGWVAPNIYYLGYAGVVRFRGVRIGGISGIFKSHDYRKGHFECPPYNQQTIRSAYHVRNIEVFKLKQLKRPIDIFMSHDWPRSIYHYGNKKQLLKMKSFFRQEVESNTLGSPAASELLQHLKPTYWFSAHLHVKFAAFMQHQTNSKEELPKATKFLALDKCLPHRDFLQIIDIEHDPSAGDSLEYDAEWIAVLKATNSLVNVTQSSWNMPEKNGLHAKWDYSATEEAIKEVLEELNHNLKIPCNFTLTAACYDPSKPQKHVEPVHTINPQTTEFCAQFGLTDINDRIQQAKEEGSARGEYEEEEEEEEMDSTGSAEEPSEYNTDNSGLSSINPDEIMLDEEGGDEDLSTCSVDPSPDHPPDFSASFSDIRIMPDSMAVSSDDAMDSTNEELEKSAVSKQVEEKSLNERPLKRIGGNENGNSGIKKIKRRNQAIYAAEDEDKTE